MKAKLRTGQGNLVERAGFIVEKREFANASFRLSRDGLAVCQEALRHIVMSTEDGFMWRIRSLAMQKPDAFLSSRV